MQKLKTPVLLAAFFAVILQSPTYAFVVNCPSEMDILHEPIPGASKAVLLERFPDFKQFADNADSRELVVYLRHASDMKFLSFGEALGVFHMDYTQGQNRSLFAPSLSGNEYVKNFLVSSTEPPLPYAGYPAFYSPGPIIRYAEMPLRTLMASKDPCEVEHLRGRMKPTPLTPQERNPYVRMFVQAFRGT
ncbi:MAG: hypothetical protein HY834_14080 [Devosia nanyangense]|uniref:Uncharacterized protein n=1 Tax=Devosia nanyangense TaxID=1228055 RepID=A0A933L5Q4_9HYPH|nr:hypothetical protein [Devosia nanyangense]